jgi:pimeloyl-ACP methyl ester carboxylesterase
MAATRREFLATTAAAGLALARPAASDARQAAQAGPGPGALRTVRTGVLEIAYEERGSATGVPVVCLHGFPDDVRAYDGVAASLAADGHRVLVPYLRGYGPTRFLDPASPRSGQQAAIGQDLFDFVDALGLDRVAVCGFDWGGRAACIFAALHPERTRAAVLIGGYSIQNTIAAPRPASPEAEYNAWYQWYFNTERGRLGLTQNRRPLCRFLWKLWSPTWRFTDDDYARTAASFDNPDFVDVVIHSYRHRNVNAPSEPRFVEMEKALAARPPVQAPTVLLYGGDDAFGVPPESAAEKAPFRAFVARHVVAGAGHFVPHETPRPVADAVREALAAAK